MSSYTQILYQIVFATKHRVEALTAPNRHKLFSYIHGILKNKKCHAYIINGVEDHLHIITHIHPSIALASLVKDIKLASSDFIKRESLFIKFNGWQNGYGAFTYSISEKDRLIKYVENQEEHHKSIDFKNEYRELLNEHEIEFEEKYLF
jgi:putative transposase